MPLSPSLLSRRRLEMVLASKGLHEVPLLGRYNHTRAELPVPEHQHGDIVEICFLVKGRQTYRVHGRDYHLRGGDIFVAFPHEQHSSAGKPQEKGVLYWLMVRRTGKVFFGLSPKQSRILWKSLCGMTSRHFRGTNRMKERLDTLTILFNAPPTPLRATRMAAETLSYLLEVIDCAGRHAEPGNTGGRMNQVYLYIQENLGESLSVPDLAEKAGLSVARFKARFKEETGVPPGEYVLRAKVDESKRLLSNGGKSVTEIAYDLGFSSSQYFATVFKRFTGVTPRNLLHPVA